MTLTKSVDIFFLRRPWIFRWDWQPYPNVTVGNKAPFLRVWAFGPIRIWKWGCDKEGVPFEK
jgi:hypothetical protein